MIFGLPITIIDIFVGVTILLSAFFSYQRGFIHEALTIASWLISVIISIHYHNYVLPFSNRYIANLFFSKIISVLILFIISFIICSFLVSLIASMVNLVPFIRHIDKTLGFIFGIIRGLLIVSLLFFVFTLLWKTSNMPKILKDSYCITLLQIGSDTISSLLPYSWTDKLSGITKTTKLHLINSPSQKNINALPNFHEKKILKNTTDIYNTILNIFTDKK